MKIFTLSKDNRKRIRSVIQTIVLAMLLFLLIRALFHLKTYTPFAKENREGDSFVALSYFGVDREESSTLISTKRLEEHMKILNKNGYVTITQEDIAAFYKEGTPLPDKSLFLIFEDGRKDTAIFSSKIMEKYNYHGTVLSYAEKFKEKDPTFLSPKDLENLEKSSYWEFGTNGYRLSYINVFDRYENYLGELNLQEFNRMRKYLGRNYNQYLMDYIRDEDDIPKESHSEMVSRISWDYKEMEELYRKHLGGLPELYVLMHANTGRFGNHERVSEVNEEWIKKLFTMNFNREGNSRNDKDTNIYDLTRMQPQAYWYPNHLMMRIKADNEEAGITSDLVFETGDVKRAAHWEVIKGAAEFREDKIVLTSEPKANGILKLRKSEDYKDIVFSTALTGNILGIQRIYLRTGSTLEESVMVELKDNIITVYDNGNVIYERNLAEFDGISYKTKLEDLYNSLKVSEELYKRNESLSYNMEEIKEKIKELEEGSIADGEDYIPEFQNNEEGNRKLELLLTEDTLAIRIDGKEAISNLTITRLEGGSIYLESAFGEFGYSQRNIADDVYDGVFEEILIHDGNNHTFYDNRLDGIQLLGKDIKKTWNRIINWFIKTL